MKKFISFPLVILIFLLIVQIIIFAPRVGQGFVTDDLTWLENVVPDGRVDYLRPFSKTTGFFRPLVGFTFGLQFHRHGMNAAPYGFFNLFLHLMNIILLYLLLRGWKKTKPYALWAVVLFALNARAVNMAVGWISGRTTLLFTFFMLLTLYSYLKLPERNPLRFLLTAVFFFAALLAKESAAAAPVFIFLFSFFGFSEVDAGKAMRFVKRLKSAFASIAVFVLPLLVYFVLRFNSDAMSPLNAPDVYGYSFSPLLLLKNLSEYIIRAGQLDFYILIIILFMMLVSRIVPQTFPAKSWNLRAFLPGVLWFFAFLLPLLPVPSRSDLYVYLPQVGLHIAALTFIVPLWKKLTIKKDFRRYVSFCLIFILSTAWLGYLFFKAESIEDKGRASSRFTDQVVYATHKIPPGSEIVIVDKHYDDKYSPAKIIAYGFNSLLNLYYPEKNLSGKIIPPDKMTGLTTKPGLFVFSYEKTILKKIE